MIKLEAEGYSGCGCETPCAPHATVIRCQIWVMFIVRQSPTPGISFCHSGRPSTATAIKPAIVCGMACCCDMMRCDGNGNEKVKKEIRVLFVDLFRMVFFILMF